jgi:hypothetical protein
MVLYKPKYGRLLVRDTEKSKDMQEFFERCVKLKEDPSVVLDDMFKRDADTWDGYPTVTYDSILAIHGKIIDSKGLTIFYYATKLNGKGYYLIEENDFQTGLVLA